MIKIRLTIILLTAIIGFGLFYCFRETPLQTKVVFEEDVRPGKDRLFVPVKIEIADSLFTALTGGDKRTARVQDGLFVVSHSRLGRKLSDTGMGDPLWNELQEVDSLFYRSDDGNELRMSMSEDEVSEEDIVWIPAGVMSLFVP